MGRNIVLATAGYDRSVRLWDCNAESTYRTLHFPESQVNDLCFSSDNELLIVGGFPRAAVFNVSSSTPNPTYVFDDHRGNVTEVGCDPDGKWMYSCSDDRTVKLWNTKSPQALATFKHSSPVNCIAIHPNGNYLYAGDQDGFVKVWDITASKLAKEVQPQSVESVEAIAVSHDGNIIVGSNFAGASYFWSLEKDPIAFDPICRNQTHHRHVLKVAFDYLDEPKFAAALTDGTVKILKVDIGKIETESDMPTVGILDNHTRWVWGVAFTSDSEHLFSASSDMTAVLVHIESGKVSTTFEGHQKAITCLAIAEVQS